MPFATNAGVRLYWRLEGAADRPVVLLLHSLGADLSIWDLVAPLLLPRFRLLRMDSRGHGASDAPPGDYRLPDLANDAQAVMDAAGIQTAAVCGIALGGAVALTLALASPSRVRAVVCACSTAQVRAADWAERVQRVRAEGMAALVEAAMTRFFSEPFARAHEEIIASMRSTLRGTDPVGYTGCAAAIRDMNLVQQLGAVRPPVLLLSGSLDVATPFEPHGAQLLAALPDARHAVLPSAHLACLEAPGEFASAVADFLRPQPQRASQPVSPPRSAAAAGPQETQEAARALYEAGLKIRREVLGDAWVDRALAGRTAFNADFQEMITRCAWQEIWSRPGLDRRTRRLLVLATTVALGRWEEFRLHVRAGLGLTPGGFSEEELREVLMQSALYAGVPAANTAFAEAATILRDLQRPE